MANKELTSRSYNFEMRAEKDEAQRYVIEGRAIVYDSMTDLGWCNEVIEAGALTETDLTDVRFLVNHDISKIPLARSRRNNENSTMQLIVDDEGVENPSLFGCGKQHRSKEPIQRNPARRHHGDEFYVFNQ